jgi:hypothetical protein
MTDRRLCVLDGAPARPVSWPGHRKIKPTLLASNRWRFSPPLRLARRWLRRFSNSINMSQNFFVQAAFGTTLGTAVAGSGTVSAQPAFPLYPYGSTVELTAVPGQGDYFARWGNAASGSQNPLSFSVTTANPTVSALFASLSATNAALTVLSDNGGYVAVSPSASRYPIGSTNVLTAVPYGGQSFSVGAETRAAQPIHSRL